MSIEDPLVPRPAATVMLVRDTRDGIKVFLMRRHRQMEFVGGVMVFPGGGVDDRDRNADIAWAGPDTAWWARAVGRRRRPRGGAGLRGARETFEECGVLFAGRGRRSAPARRRRFGLSRAAGGAREQGAFVR